LPRLFCQLGITKPLGDGLNSCNYVAAAVASDAALTPESDSANLLHSRINHMFQTVLLRDHMDHSDTFAAWLHEQFAYEFVAQALHDWQREFKAGQNDGNWRTVIALENGQLLGGAALAKDDSPDHPALGPWLACVLVAPLARQRGVAERLIAEICSTAKGIGHQKLYLHTHDRRDYYAKRGWEYLESFHAWGKEHSLMQRLL
jgi:N-acetylglutamate synthase-like GNAT family acetyltransferase